MSDSDISEFTKTDQSPETLSQESLKSSSEPIQEINSPTEVEANLNAENLDAQGGYPDPTQLFVYAGIHLNTLDMLKALVQVCDTHAWMNMGFVANESGEMTSDLPSAQLAIDSLSFLIGKIEKTLPQSDARELQRRLNDLRVNYLAKVREV